MNGTVTGPPDLSIYWQWVRRYWWVVMGGMAVGLLVGALLWSVLPKTYQATTAVLVTPAVAGGQAVNMDTELQVVKSATVARLAAENLGAPEQSGSIRPRLDLFVPPNSTVLEVTYNGDSPESARDGAQAVADAYLTVREEGARTQIDSQVAALQAQRDALADEASQLRTSLADQAPDSATAQRTQVELEAVLRRVAQLDTDIAGLSTTSVTPGVVITEAQLPRLAASPNPILLFSSALMLGLLLGIGVAMLRHVRDSRTIHSVEQLGRLPGVTHVGDVSQTTSSTLGQVSPATRRTLERVLTGALRTSKQGGSLVLVTSPQPTHSAATIALAMGELAAGRGGRGVLVLASATSPTMQRMSREGVPPLTTVVQDSEHWSDASLPRVGRVPVASAVNESADWAPLVWDQSHADALALLVRDVVVVVEAPALSESADAFSLAQGSAAVVLVVPRETDTEDAREATSQLMGAEVPVIALLGPAAPLAASEANRSSDQTATPAGRTTKKSDKKSRKAAVEASGG